MPKDESRVQSLLSAFTRKRAAPPTEKVKPETPKSAYTPEMRAAAAGVAAAALDVVVTSGYNSGVGDEYRLSPGQQVMSALKTGAQVAGAVGAFTHTEGKPMAARLALTGAGFLAPPVAVKALNAATNMDLVGSTKMTEFAAAALAAAALAAGESGSTVFGKVAVSRPYL